jgi:Cytochrome c7 and related cytochrome c
MPSDPRFSVLVAALALLVSLGARAQSTPPPAGPPPAAATAPVQPLPYSHKTHVGLGLQCRMCHTNPDAGKLMTFPPTAFCMGCHQSVAADRPSIQKLAEYAKSGEPIPWVRVYRVPDYVYWRHGSHLEAEVACTECHGPVAERDVITLETNVTRMLGCQTCHDKRQAYTDCVACHAPRQ